MMSVILNGSSFHNPSLKLSDSDKQHKIAAIVDEFKLSESQVHQLRKIFHSELEEGLRLSDSERTPLTTSMLMINTFVPALQSIDRKELRGDYLALDIGSTNFRVLYFPLAGDGSELEPTVQYYDIPSEYRKGHSSKLFHFLAESIDDFLSRIEFKFHNSSGDEILPLGFTFSFPMIQNAIDVGLLKTWTKNFDLPDAVKADIGKLLQQELDASGNRHRVQVVAILNDSTGTLIKGSYLDSDCAIGVIMGSGHNACYLERLDRIEKWTDRPAQYHSIQHVLVNMECGAFGDNGSIGFVRNRFDRAVDAASLFPGSFTFEKYLSGHFLGELLRYTLLECVAHRLILNGVASECLQTVNSIKSSDISIIESDCTDTSAAQLYSNLGYPMVTGDDLATLQYACALISLRVATILAATLSTLIERVQPRPRTVVAIDGSLYKKHPKMHRLMSDLIRELLPPQVQFELILAQDGSGKGAAIVAALATKLDIFTHHQNQS